MITLATPLRFLRGVGEARAALLESKGLSTVEDLLYYLPFRYEDRTRVRGPAGLRPGETATIIASVRSSGRLPVRNHRLRVFVADVGERGASLRCKWFNAPYLERAIRPGVLVALHGRVEQDMYDGGLQMVQPQLEILPALPQDEPAGSSLEVGRIVPIYESAGGGKLTSRFFRRTLHFLIEAIDAAQAAGETIVEDNLPSFIVNEFRLLSRWRALREVHFPPPNTPLGELEALRTPAHVRLIFEEFFYFEAGLLAKRKRAREQPGISFRADATVRESLKKILPFHPTTAQKRALAEIVADMRAPRPMRRLLQGDVGSGKTMVALQAAVIAVENKRQVAIMAPTEILAAQHYFYFRELLSRSGYHVALLSRGASPRERKLLKRLLREGLVNIVVGTHALIQHDVQFKALGLVIIDEQHRFGVMQRQHLMSRGAAGEAPPDTLVMTATPIPRTLALTLYGDLDLSVIDELPAGRRPIITRQLPLEAAAQAYALVREQIRAGAQAFIVYPVIDEMGASASESELEKPAPRSGSPRLLFGTELKSALQMYEELRRKVFPDLKVGLLHGRLSSEEKEATMRAFKAGEIDVLVGTTVVEVGVDVPNASVMVIEQAERFGLSQLHQLRGRVGRGPRQSHCILLYSENATEAARQRLNALEKTQDGFELSEIDLRLRGPGEFLGTKQSGVPSFRVANLVRDRDILEWARKTAAQLIEQGDERERERVLQYLRQNWNRHYGLIEVG